MTRIDSRRMARFALTAGLATSIVLTGATVAFGDTSTATLPTGTVLAARAHAISGSYIVVLKSESTNAAQVAATSRGLAKRYGGRVLHDYSATVDGFQAGMTATEAGHLAADASVKFVEQDATVGLSATQAAPTWGLDRIDQSTLPLSKTYTSTSAAKVTAYVLDTGIRTTHNEFGGRARNGWDFIDNDAVAGDCNGHGTHVAGTIGGKTYGVAKDVKLVAVRVLDCTGSGSYSEIIAGVDWVTRNAVKPAVANMSIGGTVSAALNAAVAQSIKAGVTYAVAAGNDHRSACDQSPAAAPNAITVGATDITDTRASFSNYGKCVDIFAPGVQITSASYRNDSASAVMSGTSMASPHVAGAAALVLGAHPAWTPAQVRDSLVANATTGAVRSAGSGSPNALLNIGWLAPARTDVAAKAVLMR